MNMRNMIIIILSFIGLFIIVSFLLKANYPSVERIYEIQLEVDAPFSNAILHITENALLDGNAVINYEASSQKTGIDRLTDTKKISLDEYNKLSKLITNNKFWSFDGEYVEEDLMDATTYTITVKSAKSGTQALTDARVHSVSCYGTCPKEITEIIIRIKELWGKEILEVGV